MQIHQPKIEFKLDGGLSSMTAAGVEVEKVGAKPVKGRCQHFFSSVSQARAFVQPPIVRVTKDQP